ncbi:mitochondrial 39-S ribosomal protein L47 (MRP-L47)-domain-containing protein [Zopfochytrium polystomum]|nr:mitochondrial 39-S ribosomal protein L47 (MRP-L47)-domain-containing protein [Zopfochytrium polystomum]
MALRGAITSLTTLVAAQASRASFRQCGLAPAYFVDSPSAPRSTSTATVGTPLFGRRWLSEQAEKPGSPTTSSTSPPGGRPVNSLQPFPDVSVSLNPKGRGLLDFFDNENGWVWKQDELKHGRAWTCEELRAKSFDDLHKLWWVCLKEQNKLLSQRDEARRFEVMFLPTVRLKMVRLTMRNIKMVVWERRIAYIQAQAIVERETTRISLYEEVRSQMAEKGAPISDAAVERKVEAMMQKRFPIPVHLLGKRESTRKAVERDSRKRARMRVKKGSRWYVV